MYEGFYYGTRTQDVVKAAASSAGQAVGSLGPCPEGFCWYVERFSCYVSTDATPTLELYVQSILDAVPIDKAGRQDYTPNGDNDAGGLSPAIFVGPGQYLVAVWASCTSGDKCQMSAQIRVHELMPVVATAIDLAQSIEGAVYPLHEEATAQ